LHEIAQSILKSGTNGLDYQVIGGKAYSVADQFELLTLATSQLIEKRTVAAPVIAKGLFGPDGPPPLSAKRSITWPAFRDATLDVRDFVQAQGRVPARVFIGPDAVPPADYLFALASVYDTLRLRPRPPTAEGITLGSNIALRPERHIAKDTPNLFGGWIIHKEGFRAPKILEVARLQAWTLKPAIRNQPQLP